VFSELLVPNTSQSCAEGICGGEREAETVEESYKENDKT